MPADLAVVGARITTLDPDRPHASALAVTDGSIVAVGDDAEVRALCDASTTVLDGRGAVITPGLTDGHQHLFEGAEVARGVDFDRVADLDGIRAALAAERERVGPGAWIQGFALEYAAFGGRPFHHELIDAAAGDGPMLVHALDMHTSFANAEALRVAGVTGPRQFPDGSSIVCDEGGRPTGELRERSATDVVHARIPEPSHEQRLAWYAEAIRWQNAVGITGIHLMNGDPALVDTLAELEAAGRLGMRVALHYFIDPDIEASLVDELTRGTKRTGRRWRADGAKFMIDGVVETGTAWLEQPDTEGGGTASMWPEPSSYSTTVRRFHDAGFRIATHAIGDRAVREVLDVYATLPGGARRHRIEHVETAPPETIARFAPMGVTASMQPIHMRWIKPDLSDPWSQRLGPHRCEHAMPSGEISAAGARVVLGSDWPVAPFDPRLGFFAAQLRRAPDLPDEGRVGNSRALTGTETLLGYTRNAAAMLDEGEVAGMLREGFRADFVLWGDDPAQCPAEDVTELPVLATVVDGEIVHRADDH